MSVIKCKMCGGEIEFEQGATVGTCKYCKTKQTLPKLDDDRRSNLYDRASHFRRNNDFDKASSIYEQILTEDTTDAEAYWSLVLCRYGIEYVEDPATHKRVPTVNRAQFTSIFDDDNYKSAVRYADSCQRELYEEEAKEINEIQKGILAISQNEEPFDVFICYKETDSNGRRTPDSVLANDLYHQLTQEGFKVFFARITLEDKLGTAYEPYIFAALNSAKVMVVLGTRAEYFNAPWVKNEWSRYLALIKTANGTKVLIPAYRDMDPYDLPDEFSHLQALDMSKLGFMQDLIRGIKKLTQTDEPKTTVKETVTVVSGNANVAPLLERAFLFLEDGKWQDADIYCEKVLDIDPKNAEAYLGKLMAELHVRTRKQLADCADPFDDKENYGKVIRFGNEKLKAEMYRYIESIKAVRLASIYNGTVSAMNEANSEAAFKSAAYKFRSIPGFKDADALAKQCLEKAEVCRKDAVYASAVSKMVGDSVSKYNAAIDELRAISGWKDADSLIAQCYDKVEKLKQKIEAIANALKKGRDTTLNGETTLEDKLAESKAKIEKLERVLSIFSVTQTQIQLLQGELNGATSQEKQLSERRSRLGIFSGKQKKQIDEELTSISVKKSAIAEQIDQKQNAIGRYSTVADLERDLNMAKNSAASLEAQIERNRAAAGSEYTYEEALKIYLSDPDIATEINKMFLSTKIISAIQSSTKSFYFGKYVQEKNGSAEPIEWLVLEKKHDKALIISKYALDCQQYNTSQINVTWETCSLRKWLNNTFFSNAFSLDEQKAIQTTNTTVMVDKNSLSPYNTFGHSTADKVFLLSISEANKYFGSDDERQCKGTAYCFAKGAYKDNDDNCWWWLRSPNTSSNAPRVGNNGVIHDEGSIVLSDFISLRPALWISLED